MSEWNATTYEGKPTILRVVREQAERMFAMAEQPDAWEAPTACESWQVRDIIGHLVDTTEGYLPNFDIGRQGGAGPEPHGLVPMSELVDAGARALRKVPREELLDRLRDDADRMMNGGTVRGDRELAGRFRALFFPI